MSFGTHLTGGGVTALVATAMLVSACGSSAGQAGTGAHPTGYGALAPAAPTSAKVSIGTTAGPSGSYLTGAAGRALYLWVADGHGRSACSGACAQVWPPVIAAGAPAVSGGARASDLGTITRSDGTKQVTYQGHPLYYYVTDSASGMTHGEGSDSFGAKWWLVAPAGTAITTAGGQVTGHPTSTTARASGWA